MDKPLDKVRRIRDMTRLAFPILYLERMIERVLLSWYTLIDVGCGKGNFLKRYLLHTKKLQNSYLIGLDIFLPYLLIAKKNYQDVILCDVMFMPVKNGACDVTIAMDVIEHLDKSDGYELLEELERITERQIIITTPVGYNAKRHLEDDNPWQRHRSAWWPSELRRLGYKVRGFNGLRPLRGELAEFKVKSKPWCHIFHVLSLLTQLITYRLVEAAYQMICIKVKI